MDWSKTKSIFIMVFFVLDIFLLYQFLEKKNNYQFEYIAEASIEELLQEEEIQYASLPKQKWKEQFLIAQSKIFEKKDTKDLLNQKVNIVDETKLSQVALISRFQSVKTFNPAELEKLVEGISIIRR